MDAKDIARIRRKYKLLSPEMNERSRRQWAASEAREFGYGGTSLVAKATGLARPTIMAGLRELDLPKPQRLLESARVRRPGGGRHPARAAGVGGGSSDPDPARDRRFDAYPQGTNG